MMSNHRLKGILSLNQRSTLINLKNIMNSKNNNLNTHNKLLFIQITKRKKEINLYIMIKTKLIKILIMMIKIK